MSLQASKHQFAVVENAWDVGAVDLCLIHVDLESFVSKRFCMCSTQSDRYTWRAFCLPGLVADQKLLCRSKTALCIPVVDADMVPVVTFTRLYA